MVVAQPGNPLQAHFGRYTGALYIVLAVFLVGGLFGALALGTLTVADRVLLIGYIHRFVQVEAVAPTWHGVFRPALTQNLKLLGLLYLLGVSVAGMPFVVIIVFFRGFVLGFSVAFLVGTLHWSGIWLSLVTIGLDNMFLLPALLIVAAVGLGFSWELISPGTRDSRPSALEGFAYFTGLVMVMGLVFLVGTGLESYVAPGLVHWLSPWGV